MAKSPVILNPNEENACALCNDEGVVYRPEWEFEHFVGLREYDEIEGLVTVEHSATTKMGGIDACPACAARAESAFRDRVHTYPKGRVPIRLQVVR